MNRARVWAGLCLLVGAGCASTKDNADASAQNDAALASDGGAIDAEQPNDASQAHDANTDATLRMDATVDGGSSSVLKINEVMAANATSCMDDNGDFDDWIEIYNPSGSAVSLAGYTISDDATDPFKATLAGSLSVPAHGYLVLWADDEIAQGDAHLPFKLSAGGEAVVLFDSATRIVDQYAWTSAAGDDVSYARLPDGTGDFASCAASTCGASNGTACTVTPRDGGVDASGSADMSVSTPDASSPADAAVVTLYINEVLPANAMSCFDAQMQYEDWIEIYNPGSAAVNLEGYSITDDSSMPTKHVLGSVTVPAGGYAVLWADDDTTDGADHLAFKLSASGETVALYSPSGTLLDSYTWMSASDDVSFGRYPNGTGEFYACIPTCGTANPLSCAH